MTQMKKVTWDPQKASILRHDSSRGNVSFEECVIAIEDGRVLADLKNPSMTYEHQKILVLEINNYAYVVPYVESEDEIFLKTVFPSRKFTNRFLRRS